jgi:hypothetical protein
MMGMTISIWTFVCWLIAAAAFGWTMCSVLSRRSIKKESEKDGEARLVKRGQRVFVRQFWSDERGNMFKNRRFTVLNIFSPYDADKGEIPDEHFIQLVGDEEEDAPTRKALGLE